MASGSVILSTPHPAKMDIQLVDVYDGACRYAPFIRNIGRKSRIDIKSTPRINEGEAPEPLLRACSRGLSPKAPAPEFAGRLFGHTDLPVRPPPRDQGKRLPMSQGTP